MPFPSASGLLDIQSTPLGRVGYHNTIIKRIWDNDFLPEITNSRVTEDDFACNQIVQFQRQPLTSRWRRHVKGQDLIADQIAPEAFCMQICNAAYKAYTFSNQDIREACERWEPFEASFKDSVYQSIVTEWREWVLSSMIAEAHVGNKGRYAGRNGNYDLGSVGNPRYVHPENIVRELSNLRSVLKSRNRWQDGKMFIVIPDELYGVIASSNYANAAWTGSCAPCSMGIDGFMPQQLLGFNVIQSGASPTVVDATGNIGFYIIAGHVDAYAFIADIVEGRIMQMPNSFTIQYQMQAIWGGKAIEPDALAIGYWTIDNY